jgi:protein involved in ribonucleotide reduction
MKIIYFSKTGNIKRFSQKIEHNCIDGSTIDQINEKYILITYTFNFGEIPEEVGLFLKKNHNNLKAVIGSGNKNWGILYNKAAIDISQKYNVKLLYQFELAGNIHDVNNVNKIITDFEKENDEIYRI